MAGHALHGERREILVPRLGTLVLDALGPFDEPDGPERVIFDLRLAPFDGRWITRDETGA